MRQSGSSRIESVAASPTATYLKEHADVVVGAIRHSKDLIAEDGAWETITWVRAMADALKLAQELREGVFKEAESIEGCTDVCVGVVRRSGAGARGHRWGVLVRLARE